MNLRATRKGKPSGLLLPMVPGAVSGTKRKVKRTEYSSRTKGKAERGLLEQATSSAPLPSCGLDLETGSMFCRFTLSSVFYLPVCCSLVRPVGRTRSHYAQQAQCSRNRVTMGRAREFLLEYFRVAKHVGLSAI